MKNNERERIFKAKALRRKELAKLPFEEKIKILIKLQKIAKNIKKNSKEKVWKIKY